MSYGQALIESGDYARGIALVDQHFSGMHPTYQPQIASDMATIAALSGDGARLLSYRRLNPDVNLVWVANQYAMTTGDLATARALAREGQQAGRTDAPMFPMTDDEIAK